MTSGVTTASAPGKVILLGEHAVVYGRPALAVPVHQVRAEARVYSIAPGSGLWIEATDLGQRFRASDDPSHPLVAIATQVLRQIGTPVEPDLTVHIHSSIPVASGLGSGTAVSTAIARALSQHLGHALSTAEVCAAVYEVEKLYHGTPSGIDNTVIAYEQPVYFIRRAEGNLIQPFATAVPIHLLIADTGIRSPTRETVGDVRVGWLADPQRYERLFDRIGALVKSARQALAAGDVAALGPLMNANHHRLGELGISSPALDRLVDAARSAGAAGAKLSGGGRGGNIIALVEPPDETVMAQVRTALQSAGAGRVLQTVVQ